MWRDFLSNLPGAGCRDLGSCFGMHPVQPDVIHGERAGSGLHVEFLCLFLGAYSFCGTALH